MRTFRTLLVVVALFSFALLPAVSHAQDDAPVACDSTLVTLLLMAEHDYDYLSHMLDSEMGMPNVDLGQYSTLINDIIAMMQAMSMDMTEEEMATMEAHQMMVTEMMAMTTDEMLHSYDMAMGMEAMDDSMMTSLTPGIIEGENELCTTLRADVEKFLVAHILTEMQSMDDM